MVSACVESGSSALLLDEPGQQEADAPEDVALKERGMGWEAYGMDAWRQGDWRMLRLPPPYGNSDWQLYDLTRDPGEITDMAEDHPDLVRELAVKWEHYARTNEVVHPDEPVAYGKPVSPGKY